MELSNQKQTPITYEQVRLRNIVCQEPGVLKYLRNYLSWSDLKMFWPLVAPPTAGLCSGQAAGRRGVSGVLRIHLGEKHPQRVPHRSHGLHQQAAAAAEEQPHPPPLQKTPAPPQQVGFALLHLQEGESQELLGHVSGELSQATVILRPQAPCLFGLGEGGVGMVLSGRPAESFPHPPENQTPLRRGGHLAVHLLLNLRAHLSFSTTVYLAFKQPVSVEVSVIELSFCPPVNSMQLQRCYICSVLLSLATCWFRPNWKKCATCDV